LFTYYLTECSLMIECRYKERVKEALECVRRGDFGIMSIIIDGMDQNNCKVPYDGSQCTFTNSLKQVHCKNPFPYHIVVIIFLISSHFIEPHWCEGAWFRCNIISNH
jgi:hypothetical protein